MVKIRHLADGTKEIYSDKGYKLMQNETGVVFDSPVLDLESSNYTYTETSTKTKTMEDLMRNVVVN